MGFNTGVSEIINHLFIGDGHEVNENIAPCDNRMSAHAINPLTKLLHSLFNEVGLVAACRSDGGELGGELGGRGDGVR